MIKDKIRPKLREIADPIMKKFSDLREERGITSIGLWSLILMDSIESTLKEEYEY